MLSDFERDTISKTIIEIRQTHDLLLNRSGVHLLLELIKEEHYAAARSLVPEISSLLDDLKKIRDGGFAIICSLFQPAVSIQPNCEPCQIGLPEGEVVTEGQNGVSLENDPP